VPEVSKSIFALSQERLSGYEGRGKPKDAMHRTVDARSSCVGFRKDKRRTETAAKRKFLFEPRERFFRFLSVRRQKGTSPPFREGAVQAPSLEKHSFSNDENDKKPFCMVSRSTIQKGFLLLVTA
jgi:hypothetical protein